MTDFNKNYVIYNIPNMYIDCTRAGLSLGGMFAARCLPVSKFKVFVR